MRPLLHLRVRHVLPAFFLTSAFLSSADTVSRITGVVTRTTTENQSTVVSYPFDDNTDVFVSGGLAERLAADGQDGDWLHIWVGKHFTTYVLNSGTWTIRNSSTQVPASRLLAGAGKGYLVTRKATGSTTMVLAGNAPEDANLTVGVAAESWQLIAYPYPTAVNLTSLPWTGAEDGDKIRLWDAVGQSWQEYERTAGTWTGPDVETAVLELGGAFLYFNSTDAKNLSFTNPYAE